MSAWCSVSGSPSPRRRRPRDFAGDPEAERAYELYRYLSYLEEHVVDALSSLIRSPSPGRPG